MRWSDEAFRELGLLPPAKRVPLPFGPQDSASILDGALASTPDAEAIVGRYRRCSYRELDAQVRAAAQVLREAGVRPGDRVAACIGNHPEVVIAFLASQRLGAVWVGLNVALSGPEKAHMLKDCEPAVLIAEPRVLEQLGAEARPPRLIGCDPAKGGGEFGKLLDQHAGAPDQREAIDPWAPAGIAYTSGTTGFPKGAVHSQHNIAMVASVRARTSSFSARHGVATPLTILNLMTVAMAAFSKGATLICLERLYAPEIAEWVARERIQSLNSAPAVLYDMLTRPDIDREALRTLRTPTLGSAYVPEAQVRLCQEFFGGVTYTYGLTEAPTGVASTVFERPSPPGSVGKANEHVEIEIHDEAGYPLPPGVVGEICVGPRREGPWAGAYTAMLGYWKKPEETAQALRNGWLRTGDLGELNAAGDLFVRGRLKDLVIRGGANIYPAEVERVLLEDEAVLHCAVTGKPDERLGETLAAFVQLRDPAADQAQVQAALEARCAAALSGFKVPSTWIFVSEMPRNQMNKIVKPRLKALYFQTA